MTERPQAAQEDRATPSRLFLDFAGSRVVGALLSLATIVVVTRGVSVSTAGVYVAAISYALLLASFVDLGTGPHLVRQAVLGSANHHISVYVWTRAFVTLVVVVIGAIGAVILFPEAYRSAAFISLGYVALSMYGVIGPIGQVVGDARPFRIATVAQGVLVLTGVTAVVVLSHPPSANLLVGAYVLGSFISTAGALLWAKRHMIRMKLTEIPAHVRRNLRRVIMLGLAVSASLMYLRIDQSLVLHYLGADDSAYYGIASRIMFQALLVPASLQLSIGYLLADRLKSKNGFAPGESASLSRMVVELGLGLSVAVIATSDLAILVLGGPRYEAALAPTLILAVSLLPACYSYLVGTSAVMSSRDRAYLVIATVALVFNVAANIALTPRLGVEAAAAISTITQLGVAIALGLLMGTRGGAAGGFGLAVSLVLVCAAAALKWAAHDHGSDGLNVSVSVLLGALAAFPLVSSYRRLRRLPSRGDTRPETEGGGIGLAGAGHDLAD